MAQLAKSGGAALVSRAARAALRTARREERSRQCDERTVAAAATASIAPSVSARSAIVPRLAGIPAANNGGSFRTGRSSARLGYSARASSRMASARPSARSARGGGSGGGGMLSARSVASSAAASTKSWQDEAYWLQKEADEKRMAFRFQCEHAHLLDGLVIGIRSSGTLTTCTTRSRRSRRRRHHPGRIAARPESWCRSKRSAMRSEEQQEEHGTPSWRRISRRARVARA